MSHTNPTLKDLQAQILQRKTKQEEPATPPPTPRGRPKTGLNPDLLKARRARWEVQHTEKRRIYKQEWARHRREMRKSHKDPRPCPTCGGDGCTVDPNLVPNTPGVCQTCGGTGGISGA